ncbi:PEP-CTERM sorting domain-containing protein [Marinobacter nauticus]|uniref:Secreted protein with PEP-CTERM sorting signal n=1 Tax=Marinobacter nauticus TaxID=2743 RepID=A0A368V746_MARNT|nr:PEP-CTERM sorting domain-containing protein [Marinobacter nauticus]RBP74092.1 putative secreted protein with PEP-CTERM sorting signal [Marinobacter nauticus]RCW34841.1 putative secreted protein with PEP-CTERM sorting signal [Marinobacter nauticus]
MKWILAITFLFSFPAHAALISYTYTAQLQNGDLNQAPPFGEENVSGVITFDNSKLGLKKFTIDFGNDELIWVWNETAPITISGNSLNYHYLDVLSDGRPDIGPDGFSIDIMFEVYLHEAMSLSSILTNFDQVFSNDTVPSLDSSEYGSHQLVIWEVHAVPEPPAFALISLGLAVIGLRSRYK